MERDDEFTRRRIREEVLRGIAWNRVPGYHFAGNYVGTMFEQVGREGARVQMDPGVHTAEPDGTLNIGALALLADVAMGASIRACLDPRVRLATTSLHLQFIGVAPREPLEAIATFHGNFRGSPGQHAMSGVSVCQGGEKVCFGNAVFMVVPAPGGKELPPFPWRSRRELQVALPDIDTLDPEESLILRRTEALLAAGAHRANSFIRRFLGYEARRHEQGATSTMANGPHIGNRVGHVQGGVLVGLAAVTAQEALDGTWGLTSVSASFMRPGAGTEVHATSRIVHRGRHTALVRTEVLGDGKLVLDVMTTHAFLG